MTERTIEEAKVVRRVATELIPVVASVALITVGIIQSNVAFISLGAGMMGLPGIAKAAKAIKAD